MVRPEPQIKDIAEVAADAHEKDCLDRTQAADSTTFGCIYIAMRQRAGHNRVHGERMGVCMYQV